MITPAKMSFRPTVVHAAPECGRNSGAIPIVADIDRFDYIITVSKYRWPGLKAFNRTMDGKVIE
jgi:hypothetical protein